MTKRPLNRRYVLMLKWGIPCTLFTVVLSLLVVSLSAREDPSAPNEDGTITGLTSRLNRIITDEMIRFTFDDVSTSAGIEIDHFPDTRASLLPEDMGSGVAWGDYDNDGDPDLFIVNFYGSILHEIDQTAQNGKSVLYQNNGDGSFTDVSTAAGVSIASFGMAAAWGDYDNDNDLDLYITNYGKNILFNNNGDGTFTDITDAAGVDDDRFSAGCSWADYNNDGYLDLYVCNYVDFEYRESDKDRAARQYGSEIPYTINPSSYKPLPNRLFKNNGDGTFTNVAEDAGVADIAGRSLGAVWFDFNLDGLIDLYVANDVSSNGVYLNMGDGSFANIGASSLAADYRGAMGLAVGDREHDGDFDLFVTHWLAQENALYENALSYGIKDDEGNPRIMFTDSAELLGLGQISLSLVGWATGFVDFDNDSLYDLWVVNGNTLEVNGDTTKLKPQITQLFWNNGEAGYYEIGGRACDRLKEPFVGRGGAYADYDNDGLIDLVIISHGSKAILLHNSTENNHHWISLRLRQEKFNTHAIGALISVKIGKLVQIAQVGADGSYLSQHITDLHFGLGSAEVIDELIIKWPDGTEEHHENVEVDQIVTFKHVPDYN